MNLGALTRISGPTEHGMCETTVDTQLNTYAHAASDREVSVAEDNTTKTTTYTGPSNQYSLNMNLQKVLATVTRTGPSVSESMKGQLASYVRAGQ